MQPVPWVFLVLCFLLLKTLIFFLLSKTSCIFFEFRWPPFIKTFFAPKFISIFPALIISSTELIFVLVNISASGILGVINKVFLINLFLI